MMITFRRASRPATRFTTELATRPATQLATLATRPATLLAFVFLFATLAVAQTPTSSAQPDAQKFPGTIMLAVDASDAPSRIFHAKLTVPAKAGAITLLYPKWIPGEHGPTGPIQDLT